MKPKASTLQERMGFNDPDLKSPIHDEMCLWLMKNKASVGCYLLGNVTVCYDEKDSLLKEAAQKLNKTFHDPDPMVEAEHPVKNGSYIVGFIDIAIRIRYASLRRSAEQGKAEYKFSSADDCVFIEVKPKIESFGETMRQINMYREYAYGKYAIFTPDHRFKDAFESQGIKVFKSTDVPLVDGAK